MNEWSGNADELEPVVDSTLVEHIGGGPNDGEFRRADENGERPNGVYVVVNAYDPHRPEASRVIGKIYLPRV